jgi:hypothetical protein
LFLPVSSCANESRGYVWYFVLQKSMNPLWKHMTVDGWVILYLNKNKKIAKPSTLNRESSLRPKSSDNLVYNEFARLIMFSILFAFNRFASMNCPQGRRNKRRRVSI